MSPATTLISTCVASHSSTSSSLFNKFCHPERRTAINFQRNQSASTFDQRKEINPGGHAKLSGISVTEKL